ncbi:MAG: N-formylglutamate amidohydrolase [Pseudomonadota bacterium]|jgi:N-formylglutamate amidohydrolase
MTADDGGFDERAVMADAPPAADLAPVFSLELPPGEVSPVICASPHSGRRYPSELLAAARLDLRQLRRTEDAYVDQLVKGAPARGATLLTAELGRAYVDLNRDPLELDPAMFDGPLPAGAKIHSPRVAAGLGVIPKLSASGREIYGQRLVAREIERRLALAHRPYHAALEQVVQTAVKAHGCALLLDWHSMPSSAARMGGGAAPDVVLGDFHGLSCAPSVIDGIEAFFTRQGYRCQRNQPYAGGYIMERYGRPADGVHALQIELNRSLYLDEARLELTPGFDRLRRDLGGLIAAAVRDWRAMTGA